MGVQIVGILRVWLERWRRSQKKDPIYDAHQLRPRK